MQYISILSYLFVLFAAIQCKHVFLGFEPDPNLFPISKEGSGGNGRKLFDQDVWDANQKLFQSIFRAGIGYSLKRRDLTLPIFIPGQLELLRQDTGSYRQYPNVDEMLTSLYFNQREASAMMYSHREAGDVLYRDFFNENTHSVVSTMNKVYAKATIGISPDVDFQRALRMLPEEYDEQTYAEFCDLWGCSVVTHALFGGSIESQLSIRSCTSVPDSELQHDLDIAMTTGKFPDMSYSRFTRTKRVNIVGGNPEIDDIPSRIASFDENPVLVSASLLPLYEYLQQDQQIPKYLIVNLEKAYKYELDQAQQYLNTMKEAGRRKAIEDFASQKIYSAVANTQVSGLACIGVRPGCVHLGKRPYCRSDACVNIEEHHVQMGETITVQSNDFFGLYIDIVRNNDGWLQATFKQSNWAGDSWILSQSQLFRNGCVNHIQDLGQGVVLIQYACSGCQAVITHNGPNEYLDCVCPSF